MPTVLGYDAAGAAAARGRRARGAASARRVRDLPGTFNVGGDGVLLLSQAIRRAGRVAGAGAGARGRPGRRGCPPAPGWSTSRPSRCASSTSAGWSTPRGCATEFGFTPRYDHRAGLRRLRARPRTPPGARPRRGSQSVERACSRPRRAVPVRSRAAAAARAGEASRRAGRPGHPAARRRVRRPHALAPDAASRGRAGRRRRPCPSRTAGARAPTARTWERADRRRRWPSCAAGITGDYEVDDFGFDRRPHRPRAAARCCGRSTRSGSGSRRAACENVPGRRRRAGRRQPLRHDAARRADDRRSRCTTTTRRTGTCGCSAPTWSSSTAGRRRAGPQGRAHAGLQRGRRAAADRGRAGRRVAGGLQGHRQAVQRALQAAAVRPRRLRLGGAAHRGADHPVLDRRRRGDLPDDRQRQARWPGCSALPVLPDHADVPAGSARSGWSRCRRSGSSSSASRSRTDDARRRRRRRPDAGVQPHRPGAGDDPAARSTGCWCSAGRCSAKAPGCPWASRRRARGGRGGRRAGGPGRGTSTRGPRRRAS